MNVQHRSFVFYHLLCYTILSTHSYSCQTTFVTSDHRQTNVSSTGSLPRCLLVVRIHSSPQTCSSDTVYLFRLETLSRTRGLLWMFSACRLDLQKLYYSTAQFYKVSRARIFTWGIEDWRMMEGFISLPMCVWSFIEWDFGELVSQW